MAGVFTVAWRYEDEPKEEFVVSEAWHLRLGLFLDKEEFEFPGVKFWQPLPTLGECIDGMIPKSVSASSAVERENKGDGMRTERITLEVIGWAHGVPSSGVMSDCLKSCGLLAIDKPSYVRVVDEELSDAWAQRLNRLTAERDAAIRERQKLEARVSRVLKSSDSMWSQILVVGAERDKLRARVAELEAASGGGEQQGVSAGSCRAPAGASGQNGRIEAASGGGVSSSQPISGAGKSAVGETQEPVAWAFVTTDGAIVHVSTFQPEPGTATVVPLYRQPPQPRGWLTEEEREAVEFLASLDLPPCVDAARKAARIGKALLARSSPPEVVKPPLNLASSPTYIDVAQHRDAEWIAANVKAGVAVKEVG
jgi:hypothetical protein